MRTTQSARRSTGGHATRVDRSGRMDVRPDYTPTPVATKERDEGRMKDFSDEWCFVCIDGGRMTQCDFCDRVTCTECLPLNYSIAKLETCLFVCPKCHSDTYKKNPSPYYAIYTKSTTRDITKLQPYVPDAPVELKGKYSMTASSRICTTPLLILHFVLQGIDVRGSPPVMLEQYLRPYFRDRPLAYEEVVFNVPTEEDARRQERKMTTLVRKYSKINPLRVWVAITTHADDDSGDPFISPTLSDTVGNFFNDIITFPVQCFLQGKDTLCFFFVCGGMVASMENSQQLMTSGRFCGFKHLIAFTVPALIPTMTTTLILDIGQKVILEDFPLSTYIAELLGSSPVSARHTAVAHIDFQHNKAVKYYWAKPEMRPWGQTLPSQCPKCLSLRPWGDMKTMGNTYHFRCKQVSQDGQRCNMVVSFAPPDEYERLGRDWISVKWM